jgi:hypothetical protein
MNSRAFPGLLPLLAGIILAGCATSGYSPPPERRAGDRCPVGEVWVCENRYPSRIESENQPDPFCRCQNPVRLR